MIVLLSVSFIVVVINWRDLSHDSNNPLIREHAALTSMIQNKRNEIIMTGYQETGGAAEERQGSVVNEPKEREKQEVNRHELPGASMHRILSLSDDELESIQISEMMSWYGEADGGKTCPDDFGNQLVRRWRDTRKTYCESSGYIDGATVGSKQAIDPSVECYPVKQTRHHGVCDNLCVMKDVSINVGIFGNDNAMYPVVEHYAKTKHRHLPYVKFPKGFVRSTCSPVTSWWKRDFLPGWNADLTVGATEIVSASGLEKAYACSEWVEHPVLFLQRDTFANFFHDSEDFVNVFLALAILEWSRGDSQIILTDLYPEGPFWDIWSRVYSPATGDDVAKKHVMTAWDLRKKYGSDPSRRVCFRKAAVGIYGPAAPITVASWNTPCSRTALVRAYSDFVIRGLNLQSHTHYARSQPDRTITITYMARRPYSEWPEAKFCNDDTSFFKCEYWAHMGGRAIGRMISNDASFVDALKNLESGNYNGKIVKFLNVDYNKLSFEEQIKIDLQTDIMIGPHGAGLMHNIFMRDRAVLIELSVDGSSVNRHFHNLAHWFGRTYYGVPCSNPIDIPRILGIVRNAIDSIDVEKY